MMRKLFCSASLLCFAASDLAAKELQLGYKTFCIPRHYDTLDQTTGPLFNMAGLDQAPHKGSFQFYIPAKEVKQKLSKYKIENGKFEAFLKVHVSLSNSFEQERMTGPNYRADALRLVGRYSESNVEYDKTLGIYRVSDFLPPFVIWDALKLEPMLTRAIPDKLDDYYLGYCSSSASIPGGSSGTRCDYSIAQDNFLIGVGVSEENLMIRDQITEYVKQRLSELEGEC